MIHHIKRATRHLIFWTLIASALVTGLVRLFMYRIDVYRSDLEGYLSQLLDAPITIDQMSARIRGYSPELVLQDIGIAQVKPNSKPAVQLRQIRLGFDVLAAAWHGDVLTSTSLTLVGAKLSVIRKTDGSFAVVGLKANEQDSQPLWLLKGRKYQLLDSEITWQDLKRQGRLVTFDHVDIAVMNDGNRHRLNLLSQLSKKYGGSLRVSVDFQGNAFSPDSVQGKVFLEGEQLRLAKLVTGTLPLDMVIDSGSADFKLWGDVQGSKLSQMQGYLAFNDLKLHRKSGDFVSKQLSGQFQWQALKEGWHLSAQDLVLQSQDNTKSKAILAIVGKESELQNIALASRTLDLPTVVKAVQTFVPLAEKQRQMLANLNLKGRLEHLTLLVQIPKNQVTIDGQFTKLHIALPSGIGLQNIAGRLQGNSSQGAIQFTTERAYFQAPHIFRELLAINKLTGEVYWQQDDGGWQIGSSLLSVETPDIKTKNRILLTIPKTDKSMLDMQTAFSGEDISKAYHYLPVVLNKTVLSWLDKAFAKGHAQGNMLFYGHPGDFPFEQGQGVFETLFTAEDTTLHYHQDWPDLTGMEAEIRFWQDSLQVAIKKAQTMGINVQAAEVKIPKLGISPHLLITGEGQSTIGHTLGFLQKTPLHGKVESVLQAITPSGDSHLKMDLKIPLLDGATEKVEVQANIDKGALLVKRFNLPVQKLQGVFKFTEQGVFGQKIQAEALHYPITIGLDSNAQATVVDVAGRVDVADLPAYFPFSWWEKFSGASNYQLTLQLPYKQERNHLQLYTGLNGIEVKLPEPLSKPRQLKKPLTANFYWDNTPLLPIELAYGKQFKAALQYNGQTQRLDSAYLALGTHNQPEIPKGSGIIIDIREKRLQLADWLALAKNHYPGAANNSKDATATTIQTIKLQAEQGLWHETNLGHFSLDLKPSPLVFTGALDSSMAKGTFSIPNNLAGNDKIVIRSEFMDLSLVKETSSQGTEHTKSTVIDVAPDVLPLLAVNNKKTLWQQVDLGQLTIETVRVPQGITIRQFNLLGSDLSVQASGDWKLVGKQSKTSLKGTWKIAKVSDFFNRLGLTNDLADTQNMEIPFNFHWQAAPYQFSLVKLNGQFDARVGAGRILSIEPGFGRALGVLAVAQWIKRLQLDFSDVFQEGLAFNKIDGHFDVVNGKVLTKNLVIDAIPAKITLIGETDLINKTVDYTVNVVPKSADALPIAGTIVGKVTSIITKTLAGKDQDDFLFGAQYQVKGKWDNVQISRSYKNDGLLQKTWHGITDFSWLVH